MNSDAESANTRPYFIAPMPTLRGESGLWRAKLDRIEQLGFDEVAISEHYSQGWAMEPLTALSFAAACTTELRFLTLVLNNDMRHPALLAKAIATVDVLSEGRVSLGIGAGWLPQDYEALGLPLRSPAVRIAQLREGLTVIRAFFAGDAVDYNGRFYRLDGLEALPATVQQPGPPILVGAGGPRMLDLAGTLADIVGIHVTLGPRGFDRRAASEMSAASIRTKIERVRDAAKAADRPAPILQFTPVVVVIDGRRSTVMRPGFTDYIESHPEDFTDSPAVLIGTAGEIAERVQHWRRELGIRFWHLGADVEAAGKVIGAMR